MISEVLVLQASLENGPKYGPKVERTTGLGRI